MKPLRIHKIIGFILLIGLAGCSPNPTIQGDENFLLIDDFSTNINKWNVWENKAGSAVSYYQNGLVFIINTPQYDHISMPMGSFGDVIVEATANKVAGPDDNDYGIICRYKDEKNYYSFIISSDGYFGIIKVKEGNFQILNDRNLEHNSMIRGGNEFNYLKADCIGTSLIFYVNQIKIAEVTDADFSAGKVGLIAGSFDIPGVAILFDNFVVSKP